MESRQEHWQGVYSAKRSEQLSWYQPEPVLSLRLLQEAGLGPST